MGCLYSLWVEVGYVEVEVSNISPAIRIWVSLGHDSATFDLHLSGFYCADLATLALGGEPQVSL